MNWKKIYIQKPSIEKDTGKAVLIKMPNKSKYAGYKFWFPSKLLRETKTMNTYTISFNDEFTFELKKYGNGKTNQNEVIREITLSASEFEKCYNDEEEE